MKSRNKEWRNYVEMRRQLNQSGLSRREVAKMGLLVSGGTYMGGRFATPAKAHLLDADAGDLVHDQVIDGIWISPATTPFVDPMPVPLSMRPGRIPRVNWRRHQHWQRFPARKAFVLDVKPGQHVFHSDYGTDWIWGIGGTFPGPTLDATYGEPVIMRLINRLPATDPQGIAVPEVIMHLHNFHTASESDGGPWDWTTPGGYTDHHYCMARAGFDSAGGTVLPIPPEWQDASGGDVRETMTSLFLHYHRPDFTSNGVYKGLASFVRLFDEKDTGNENDTSPGAYRLPSGAYDIPIVLADRRFDENGRLFFDDFDTEGHLGDKVTVNGVIQPFFNVEPRKYRFRLLGASPARYYLLRLRAPDGNGGFTNLPFTQVTDNGNFFEAPRNGVTQVELIPANRIDIIVDFSGFDEGTELYLSSVMPMKDGRQPERDARVNADVNANRLIKFVVGSSIGVEDNSQIPNAFRPYPPLPTEAEIVRTRTWEFKRGVAGPWLISGEEGEAPWDPHVDHELERLINPINQIQRNTAERWIIKTGGGWEHPVHIHFEEGRVVRDGNQTFADPHRVDMYNIGGDQPRELEILLRFRDFPDPAHQLGYLGTRGRHVMHCHNTTHEDNAMMVTWNIVPNENDVT